jgi:hypothetical protein
MKSVPNLISYLHEVFQNFSQSLSICFELFSFGEFVYSEIADSGPHLSGVACRCRARAVARHCRVAATCRTSRVRLKALSGQRAARPDSTPRARPTAPRHPDSIARATRFPTASRRRPTAAIPTAAVRAASLGPQPAAPLPLPRRARRRRAAVARRRLHAGEPPPPRRSVHRRRAVAQRRHAVPRSRRAPRAARPRPSWASAAQEARARCDWPRPWAVPRTMRLARARIRPSAPG